MILPRQAMLCGPSSLLRTRILLTLAHRGWLFAATVTAFLLVWAADVFWRAVDTPIGKFVRWLEARCLNPAYA